MKGCCSAVALVLGCGILQVSSLPAKLAETHGASRQLLAYNKFQSVPKMVLSDYWRIMKENEGAEPGRRLLYVEGTLPQDMPIDIATTAATTVTATGTGTGTATSGTVWPWESNNRDAWNDMWQEVMNYLYLEQLYRSLAESLSGLSGTGTATAATGSTTVVVSRPATTFATTTTPATSATSATPATPVTTTSPRDLQKIATDTRRRRAAGERSAVPRASTAKAPEITIEKRHAPIGRGKAASADGKGVNFGYYVPVSSGETVKFVINNGEK